MRVEPQVSKYGLYMEIKPENNLEEEFIERIIDLNLKHKCRISVSPTYRINQGPPHVYITIGFERVD